jgi:four helix bundle protein
LVIGDWPPARSFEYACVLSVTGVWGLGVTVGRLKPGTLMNQQARQLIERFATFADLCESIAEGLSTRVAGDAIARQLVRCSSSAGAHYSEACDAESRKDFIHKLSIAVKELRESDYWLRRCNRRSTAAIQAAPAECNELTAILVASIRTALASSSAKPAIGQAGRQHDFPRRRSANRVITNRAIANRVIG